MDALWDLFRTPEFHLTMLALAGAAALEGLVAAWAATNSRHWFWRALALFGAIVLLVPIRAYKPVLVLSAAAPLVFAIVAFSRWLIRRSERSDREQLRARPHFTLSDILLLMLVIGACLAVGLAIRRHWQNILPLELAKAATALALVTAAAYVVVFQPRKWQTAACLVLALPAASWWLALDAHRSYLADNFGLYSLMTPTESMLPITATFAGELALAVALIALLCRNVAGPQKYWLRWASASLLLTAAAPLVYLYWQMTLLAPFPPGPADADNHYRRIEEIVRLSAKRTTGIAERSKLRKELLSLLDGPNYVQFDPATDCTHDYLTMKAISDWRDLSQSLEAEAQAASSGGDHDTAASYAMANVRLGKMLERGGLQIDFLVGTAIEGTGMKQLVGFREKLSPSQMRTTLAALQTSSRWQEPLERIWARDYAWTERAYGWEARLTDVIGEFLARHPDKPIYEEIRTRSQADSVLLQTDLALRLFRLDHGRWPESLAALSPEYLSETPLDPYSAEPLRYRAIVDSFLLYSVGEDGRDDGGKFGNWAQYLQTPGYDLDVDTRMRPQ